MPLREDPLHVAPVVLLAAVRVRVGSDSLLARRRRRGRTPRLRAGARQARDPRRLDAAVFTVNGVISVVVFVVLATMV